MKIALFSDLHNECDVPWTPPDSALTADLVILAGDIGCHTHGLEWAARSFIHQPIVYVSGNHEYYSAHLGLLDEMRKKADALQIHFLERNAVEIDGVRILGCTLWSNFTLYGACANQALAMTAARESINDYWLIYARGAQQLEPRDTANIHRQSAFWLDKELSKPYSGKTVVVSHFAPHRGCIAPQHEGNELTPYFVSDMAWLMEKHPIDVWCHGHTHTNTDFIAEGGCRVISNQLGYPGERNRTRGGITFETGFRNDLLIEV